MQDFKEFYTAEASQYHARRYETTYGHLFRILHHSAIKTLVSDQDREAVVLEVACGTGHTTRLLTELGFRPICSDLTPAMMQQARDSAGETHGFIETDAFHLPIADASVDLLVSTRFLHLFPIKTQADLLSEFHRVLKPGATLLVDFDNFFSRWLMAIPYLFYNLIRYQRLAPFTIYNRIGATGHMISTAGFTDQQCFGIGGTHLVVPAWLSTGLAVRLGLAHRRAPWRNLAEQFMIRAQRSI